MVPQQTLTFFLYNALAILHLIATFDGLIDLCMIGFFILLLCQMNLYAAKGQSKEIFVSF